ncbi:MAG: hypothetical protein O7A63_01725 [Acidobacteria bacterium]|nr:hypothetical protein [Acidobacteriota bacterium]
MRVAVVLGTRPVEIPQGRSAEAPDHPARARHLLPASDRAATAIARKHLSSRFHACCRGDDLEAFRYALAAGASSVATLDDLRADRFDVVLIGSGGAGPSGDLLAAMLAEGGRAMLVLDVLEIVANGDRLIVTRDLGRGDRERLTIGKPAVLTISEHAAERHYVSRYRRGTVHLPPMTSQQSAVDPLSTHSGPWEPVRPRARAVDLDTKTGGSATDRMNALFGGTGAGAGTSGKDHLIVGDPATCARHLKRFLRHHGVLESAAADDSPVAAGVAKLAVRRPRSAESAAGPAASGRIDQAPRTNRAPRSEDEPSSLRRRGPRPEGDSTSRIRRAPRPVDPDSV